MLAIFSTVMGEKGKTKNSIIGRIVFRPDEQRTHSVRAFRKRLLRPSSKFGAIHENRANKKKKKVVNAQKFKKIIITTKTTNYLAGDNVLPDRNRGLLYQ